MQSRPAEPRRRQGRHPLRRAAFAATAVLAGCATTVRNQATILPLAAPGIPPGHSNVIMRLVDPRSTLSGPRVLTGAEIWDIATGRRVVPPVGARHALATAPSVAAAEQGWVSLSLPRGTYMLRMWIRGNPGDQEGPRRDLTFSVPQAPGTYMIGTIVVRCDPPPTGMRIIACWFDGPPRDQTALAAAMLAEAAPGAGPVTARIARFYPTPIGPLGLGAPQRPEIVVDAGQWLGAIGVAVPSQPPGERSDASDFGSATMVPTRSMGSDMQGLVPDMRGLGALGEIALVGGGNLVLPVMLAMLVVMAPVALLSLAVRADRSRARSAAEAERDAQALRAAALAQAEWGSCIAGLGAALAPGNVERHLRASLGEGRRMGSEAAPSGRWRATVTRVLFRPCGASPQEHGLEVATRWTAWRAGDADPAYDAAFSRTVASATLEPRLAYPVRAPFESPVATEAACRPLAEWCAPGGAERLLGELLRGVTDAQDAIAAAR